ACSTRRGARSRCRRASRSTRAIAYGSPPPHRATQRPRGGGRPTRQGARECGETPCAEAGATAICQSNPFERRLRDINTVSQQVQGSSIHFQTVGQYFLGLTPSARFL